MTNVFVFVFVGARLMGARLMGSRRGASRPLHQQGDDARLAVNTAAAAVNIMLVGDERF